LLLRATIACPIERIAGDIMDRNAVFSAPITILYIFLDNNFNL
jgi:hypothetical protein